MQLYLADGTPVNAPAPSLFPAASSKPSKRLYTHGYKWPKGNYHHTDNAETAYLDTFIGPSAVEVLKYLRSCANKRTGQCNPSLNTISVKTGLATSTVKANLIYLYEANVVQQIKRDNHHQHRDGKTIARLSNQYILTAVEDWTMEKVSRKWAQKAIRKIPPTRTETHLTSRPNLGLGVGRDSASNKKKWNQKKLTTRQHAREKNSRRAQGAGPAEHTPEAAEAVPAVAVPFEVPSEAPQASVPPEVASTWGEEPTAAPVDEALLAQLVAIGVAERKARKLVAAKSAEVIRQQIEWLPHRKAINPAAMLIRSIEGNYGQPSELSQHQKAREKAQEAVRQEAEQTQAVASQIQQRHQQTQEREQVLAQQDAENARLNDAWEALDESVRAPLERAVAQRMGVLSRLCNRPQGAVQSIQRVVLREHLAGTLKDAGGNVTSSESKLLE
jgi:hypothetical protein